MKNSLHKTRPAHHRAVALAVTEGDFGNAGGYLGDHPGKMLKATDHAQTPAPAADLFNATGQAPVVLVCEHASNFFPAEYGELGLSEAARVSHVAWDPGAREVARGVALGLDARLVESRVSRLIYDCNRPPDAATAMPDKSELFDIPGNRGLSGAARARRVRSVYEPFRDLLAATIKTPPAPRLLVTIHSFTPVYMGRSRAVEIGVLHDSDARLADAMLACATTHTPLNVQRNSPYGPRDGVTHTLKEHGLKNGLLNVMLEIRNDLIATPAARQAMAVMLSRWLSEAAGGFDLALAISEPLTLPVKEAGCQSLS